MSDSGLMDRAHAMGLMAGASCARLSALWDRFGAGLRPETLVGPETGMVRLTTKAGQSQTRFQFGEASCTRCVVAYGEWRGYAVHLGSDRDKTALAARLDILVQQGNLALMEALTELEAKALAKHAARQAITDATRVRFFTTKTSGS